jgi:hypothetical protein
MRVFNVLLCLGFSVLPCLGAGSDSPAASPPIAVVKHTWYLDSGLLRDFSAMASSAEVPDATQTVPGSSLNGDPASRRNSARISAANPEPVEKSKTRDVFRYEVEVRNDTGKQIRKVFWAYLFLNPETNAVVGRQRFETEAKIKPGKLKKLQGLTYNPPTTVSSVRALKQGSDREDFERVEVFRVQFDDGTFWSRRRPGQASP